MSPSTKRTKPIAALVAAGLLAPVVAAPATHAGEQDALFGAEYVSVSVEKNGAPKDLAGDTRLKATFTREGGEESVRWSSGCNFFGADIEVSDTEIDVHGIDATEIACRDALMRQDRFFLRFFSHDPDYSLSGRHLTLSTNRVTIELRRQRGG